MVINSRMPCQLALSFHGKGSGVVGPLCLPCIYIPGKPCSLSRTTNSPLKILGNNRTNSIYVSRTLRVRFVELVVFWMIDAILGYRVSVFPALKASSNFFNVILVSLNFF